jgi:hypothetical protein
MLFPQSQNPYPFPPPLMQNPLHAVEQAYGVWNSVMTEDPSGSAIRNVTQGAVVSAAIFGVIGAVLPFFSVAEGVKWGALIGAGRGAFEWYRAKDAPKP